MATQNTVLFFGIGTAIAIVAPAPKAEAYQSPSEDDYTRTCGIASEDVFPWDLVGNSQNPFAYCEVTNPEFAEGVETTLGFRIGDDDASALLANIAAEKSLGPFSFEADVGFYNFYEIDNFEWNAGAQATVELGPLASGVRYQAYWGDGYETQTTSGFVEADFGPIDVTSGYSWLSEGGEGPFLEVGMTFSLQSRDIRVSAEGFQYEDDTGAQETRGALRVAVLF